MILQKTFLTDRFLDTLVTIDSIYLKVYSGDSLINSSLNLFLHFSSDSVFSELNSYGNEDVSHISDSLKSISSKLIRRHPHVFSDAENPEDTNQVWEQSAGQVDT